jgi:hypothetical protein
MYELDNKAWSRLNAMRFSLLGYLSVLQNLACREQVQGWSSGSCQAEQVGSSQYHHRDFRRLARRARCMVNRWLKVR